MRLATLIVLVYSLFALFTPCAAASLKCEAFKIRLHQLVNEGGNNIAQINNYKLVYSGGKEGKRYEWDDIAGLNGNLNCGEHDEFIDFEADLDLSDGLKAIVFGRLMVLATYSTCALTSSEHAKCFDLVRKMADISTTEFRKEADRGEKFPGGTCDFFLINNVDAEFDVSPAAMTWTVGPGNFGPMDEKRLPLSPKRRDADE